MDRDERRARRRGAAGLVVAAVAFTVIALAGPLMLAWDMPLDPLIPFVPVLWAIVIVGYVVWFRTWARMRRGRGGGDG